MALTKQTAKKTTGGAPPGKQLLQKRKILAVMTAAKPPPPKRNRKRSCGGRAPRVDLAQELEADPPMEVDDPSQPEKRPDSPLTTPPSSPAPLKPKTEGHPAHDKVSNTYLPEVAVTDL